MKCPKCGYHSFDHLDSCKKCSIDLTAHKAKFNLRGFFAPGETAAAIATASATAMDKPAAAAEESSGSDVDFGFDFLEESDDPSASGINLGKGQDLNLDKPFDIDAETIPADNQNSAGKKDPGSEFSF